MVNAIRWIAADSPSAARRLRETFGASIRLIGTRPLAGRPNHNVFGAGYLVWSVQGFPYIIVYKAKTQPARIVRILHTSRDLPPFLADLLE